MNLVFFGIDRSLCDPRPDHAVLTKTRERLLAGFFGRYDIIILRPPRQHSVSEIQDGNMSVSAAVSGNPAGMVSEAVRAALLLHTRSRIDAITTQDPLLTGLAGYLLKKRLGVPLHIQIHGDYLGNPYWLRESSAHMIYDRMARWLLNRADAVTTVHPDLNSRLARYMKRRPTRTTSLENGLGIDVEHFSRPAPLSFRARWLGQKFQNIILYAGRLTAQKNVPSLIRAAKTVLKGHPRTRFVIAGDGRQKNRLVDQARRMGLADAFLFPGWIPESLMPAAYQSSDVFVLPSLYEGHARVLMEAAVSGLPVVTTAVTGARDIARDRSNGLMVPSKNNPAALADSLHALLSHLEKYRSAAQARRPEFMDKFDRRRCLADMARQIQNLNQHAPRRAYHELPVS